MARETETRIPIQKNTRERLKKFCNGASLPYDTVIAMFLDDVETRYGDDLFVAGQKYRLKKREQGKD